MEDSGGAFAGGMAWGTLWEQATQAVGYIIDGSKAFWADTFGAKTTQLQLKEESRLKNNKQNIDGADNKTVYIIFAVILLGLVAAYIFNQKNKFLCLKSLMAAK